MGVAPCPEDEIKLYIWEVSGILQKNLNQANASGRFSEKTSMIELMTLATNPIQEVGEGWSGWGRES